MKYGKLLVLILFVPIMGCNVMKVQDDTLELKKNPQTGEFISEDGKCYSKCLILDKYKRYSKEYVIFTGDELIEKVDIEIREIELSRKVATWVKKKADRNCFSENPDDCMVWCLIETPALTKEIKILKDTSQSSNYKIEKIEIEELVEKGNYTEYKLILCKQEITKSIIEDIQNALRIKGYFDGANSFEFDNRTRQSLVDFQRDNFLPVGNMNLETLEFLGISLN